MKRNLLPILFGFSTLVVTAGAGHAQSENDLEKVPQLANRPRLISPLVQAAAHVSRDAVLIASKGIKSVSSPSTGQFCIELRGRIVRKTAPVISVDWSYSTGNGLLAYWDPANNGCPGATRRTINVVTYSLSGGEPVLSNNVAFVVAVP